MKRLMQMVACMVMFWMGMTAQARTMHLYYTNPQGSVLAKTDAQGHILARYDYQPYGSIASGTGPNGPGYTGHVDDPETGLIYMQARYDSPSEGRFLSPDPVGVSPGDVFSFNRYAYADNNPIVNDDPTGMMPGLTDDPRMSDWDGWGNQAFWRDDHCSVCLQTSNGSGQATNLATVNVRGSTPSGDTMGTTGRVTDALFSTLFSTVFNEMKRPNHPTRVPDSFAHELFMTNAAGVTVATAPFAMSLGAGVVPVAVDGSTVVVGAMGNVALRYGPRAVFMSCLAISCRGEEKPEQFVKDYEMVEKVIEQGKAIGSEVFKQVIPGEGN